jgi:hypothetical protein
MLVVVRNLAGYLYSKFWILFHAAVPGRIRVELGLPEGFVIDWTKRTTPV